jgi:hypothetical protein
MHGARLARAGIAGKSRDSRAAVAMPRDRALIVRAT